MSFSDTDEFVFSGDELNTMTYEEARRFKLRFGKLQGERLGTAASNSEGREYLRYLLTWKELRGETKVPIEMVLAEYDKRKAAKILKAAKKEKPTKKKRKREKVEELEELENVEELVSAF